MLVSKRSYYALAHAICGDLHTRIDFKDFEDNEEARKELMLETLVVRDTLFQLGNSWSPL